MKPYGLRDRIAAAACNWILRHVASEQYRKMVDGSVRYGLASAARDERQHIGPPPSWAEDWDSPEDSVYDADDCGEIYLGIDDDDERPDPPPRPELFGGQPVQRARRLP